MRKLSRFEKMGLVAAVMVALSFFYMKRVYEPQERALRQTVGKLNKIIGEINNLKSVPPVSQVKQRLKQHRDELADLEKQLRQHTVLTGADREVSRLLSRISDLIEDKGLAVNRITPKGRTDDKLYQWHLFEVDLQGDFYRFVDLLEALGRLPDAVRVEKITLKQESADGLRILINLMI